VTEVVRRFLHEKNDDRHVTQATIDDAPHFSAVDKKRIIASYLPHEAEAWVEGVRAWLRGAWPRDDPRETLEAAGIPLMKQYAAQASHARLPCGLR
jgi:hypothetical protein